MRRRWRFDAASGSASAATRDSATTATGHRRQWRQRQVVVRDRDDPNVLDIASMNSGTSGNGHSGWPQISGDGRYVIFSSLAPSLTNNLAVFGQPYVVVGDIVEHIVTIASTRREDGSPVWAGTFVNDNHALSEDGSTLAFGPDAVNMGMGMFGSQVFATPRP